MTKIVLESLDKKFIFNFSFTKPKPPKKNAGTKGKEKAEPDNENDDEEVEVTDDGDRFPYVNVTIYRKDRPSLKYNWSGTLISKLKVPFEVPVPPPSESKNPSPTPATGTKKPAVVTDVPVPMPDRNFCRGQFWLYTNTYTGLRFIWFDIFFGNDYENEYEGCMIQFPEQLTND